MVRIETVQRNRFNRLPEIVKENVQRMHVVVGLADAVKAMSVRRVGQRIVGRLDIELLLIEDATDLKIVVRGCVKRVTVEVTVSSRRSTTVLQLIDDDLKAAARVHVRVAYEAQSNCIGVLKVHNYF